MSTHQRHVTFVAVSALAFSIARVSGQAGDDLTRRQLEKARAFLQATQYTEALRDLDLIVSSNPTSSYADDALLEVAKYQLNVAGDLGAAKAAVDTLIQKYGRSDSAPMAYLLSGRIMLSRSRAPEDMLQARGDFERVRAYFPGNEAVPLSMYYAGETSRLSGDPVEALVRFQQVNSDYPRSPSAARADLGAALCHVALEQPERAMEALQRLRGQFPGSPEARTALRWNTILYRLYVKPAAQQPPFAYNGRNLAGPAGKLKDVFALAIDDEENVFVASRPTVTVFTAEGKPTRTIASSPKGIFFDQKQKVVVVSKGAVQQEAGKAVTLSLPKPDGTPRLLEDISVGAALSTGEYLIADGSSKSVLKFSPLGKPLGVYTAAQPDRIIINDLDELALLDKDAKAVVMLTREGKPIRKIAMQGTGYQLKNPVDIAFDSLGHLYVLDRGRSTVAVFTPTGKLRTTFSVADKAPGAFHDANALAVDPAGRLYIYDDNAERIQIYQ
jgi:outer membrane protein assembly factor BamD (BamD/ComL family)